MSFTAKENPVLITALSCHVSFHSEYPPVIVVHGINVVENIGQLLCKISFYSGLSGFLKIILKS